ncbi:TPA: 50S ribosome-binding GTPase [Vibrio parahaemolyticus]|nr:50S ribosome-binding GTPase [Vibrio parahaemolyticus]HCG7284488.1 50S ribosome-binding GTPase [Vibrio parahaemolyticus]
MANANFEKEFEKQIKDIKAPNVMIVGGTGVGKSSLVNLIFGEKFADVGNGEPVTKGCHKYQKEGTPITVFDTEGYEIIDGKEDNSNFKNVVISEIKKRKSEPLSEQIHLFWYCISVSNHRITDYDLKNIKLLSDSAIGANLAIVFTQCDNDELDENDEGVTSREFKKLLQSKGIDNPCFETMLGQDDTLELDKLLLWSEENLPEDSFKESFVAAQKANLPQKHAMVKKIILATSGSASAAAGLNPVPASDSLLLMPIQMGMAVSIAKVYGFSNMKNATMALMKSQIISLLGKQLATSFLKLIPGFGQLINASVAGSLTLALGYALKELYTQAYVHVLNTGENPDWLELFSDLDLSAFMKK